MGRTTWCVGAVTHRVQREGQRLFSACGQGSVSGTRACSFDRDALHTPRGQQVLVPGCHMDWLGDGSVLGNVGVCRAATRLTVDPQVCTEGWVVSWARAEEGAEGMGTAFRLLTTARHWKGVF